MVEQLRPGVSAKEVGGVAVGVAAAEPECQLVDEGKRRCLAGVGAGFIAPISCATSNLCK